MIHQITIIYMNQHNEMNTNHAKTLDSNYKKHILWWHECPAVGQRSPLGLVDSHGKRGKGGFSVSAENHVLSLNF
jgi:hypothetical protein